MPLWSKRKRKEDKEGTETVSASRDSLNSECPSRTSSVAEDTVSAGFSSTKSHSKRKSLKKFVKNAAKLKGLRRSGSSKSYSVTAKQGDQDLISVGSSGYGSLSRASPASGGFEPRLELLPTDGEQKEPDFQVQQWSKSSLTLADVQEETTSLSDQRKAKSEDVLTRAVALDSDDEEDDEPLKGHFTSEAEKKPENAGNLKRSFLGKSLGNLFMPSEEELTRRREEELKKAKSLLEVAIARTDAETQTPPIEELFSKPNVAFDPTNNADSVKPKRRAVSLNWQKRIKRTLSSDKWMQYESDSTPEPRTPSTPNKSLSPSQTPDKSIGKFHFKIKAPEAKYSTTTERSPKTPSQTPDRSHGKFNFNPQAEIEDEKKVEHSGEAEKPTNIPVILVESCGTGGSRSPSKSLDMDDVYERIRRVNTPPPIDYRSIETSENNQGNNGNTSPMFAKKCLLMLFWCSPCFRK